LINVVNMSAMSKPFSATLKGSMGVGDMMLEKRESRPPLPVFRNILSPIKYKLEYPSVHYAAPTDSGSFDIEYTDQFNDSLLFLALGRHIHSVQAILCHLERINGGRRHDAPTDSGSFDIEYTDQFLDAVGGKVLESLLKSVEDSVYSISNEPESVGAA
jgi:hypothetical protein